jgi:hypothetical protein
MERGLVCIEEFILVGQIPTRYDEYLAIANSLGQFFRDGNVIAYRGNPFKFSSQSGDIQKVLLQIGVNDRRENLLDADIVVVSKSFRHDIHHSPCADIECPTSSKVLNNNLHP